MLRTSINFYIYSAITILIQIRSSEVHKITASNYKDLLNGEWLVKFYAPWCPACRSLIKDWEQLPEYLEHLNVNIAKVDVTEQGELNGRFLITNIPTIYHFKNGQVRLYTGKNKLEELLTFIEEAEYEDDDYPVLPWYRHPESVCMSLMAKVYQLSLIVKKFIEEFQDKKGYSPFAVYGLIAILTIMTGLFLGLVLVGITDFCTNIYNSIKNKKTKENQIKDEKQTTLPDFKEKDAPENENSDSNTKNVRKRRVTKKVD